MKPGTLATRAINQYRTRDVIPYLALRYYLENSCARSDRWASEVAVHLTQTRNLPTYFEAQHFKETQDNGQVLHRSILLPGPNEALSEAVLLAECSKHEVFEPLPCVYSYRLAKQGDKSGIFEPYFSGFRQRHQDVAYACREYSDRVVLYTDIKKFYPNIRAQQASEAWAKSCQDTAIPKHLSALGHKLLDDHSLTCQKHNQGHGLLTGPMFSHLIANQLLRPIDEAMSRAFPGKYFRYVDDVIIVGSTEEIHSGQKQLADLLGGLHLELHGEEGGKTFSIDGAGWLKGADDFDDENGRDWMMFVGDLRRYLIAKPLERAALAAAFPSAAYRASADLLIDQDDFVRKALSFDETVVVPPPVEVSPPPIECGPAALKLIQQAVKEASGPLSLAKVASMLLSKIEGLDASSWAGFGSFRSLIESLDLGRFVVTWEAGGTIHDPKRHALPTNPSTGAGNGKTNGLLPKVVEAIKGEVAKAAQPVPCGRLATLILALDSSLAADWAGKGTFRKFVESLNVKPIEFNWNGSGGIAYDPTNKAASAVSVPALSAEWADENLFKIAKQIHEVTDVPLLPPNKYRNLLAMIALDVAESPFHLMETGKRVRDRCRESGQPVSRADVNHVLRGLVMRGHVFDDGPNDAATLAKRLKDNVRSLCLREQIVLDGAMDKAIKDWIASN